ncbi:ABC transporter substrate-binding protein [Streptomyces sp. NPDC007983]|uniref:ABC transporter substrate-binding protein n=1 Tax=Streptomyces sp. NPDC007983 TaxID=3364800 RepID=UPI0036F0C89F
MTVCLRQAVFVPPAVSVVADELGLFADAGVEVETVLIESSSDQRDRLVGGDVDVGVTAVDNLLVWNRGGGELRVVAQVESTTPLRLVARSSMEEVPDLRGARLGVDAVDNGFAVVLRRLLARRGLESADCEWVPVGGVRERFEALREGTVDATLLGPPLDELAIREGLVELISVVEEMPDFPGQGVVAGAAALHDGERLSRYLGALEAARRWLSGAPREQALEVLARGGYGTGAARAALRTCPVSLVPVRAGLERIVSMRRELDMLPDPAPRVEDLYDSGPLGLELGP